MGYGNTAATIFALITSEPEVDEAELDGQTFYVANGVQRLPQGTPNSPAITNVVCRRMDARPAGPRPSSASPTPATPTTSRSAAPDSPPPARCWTGSGSSPGARVPQRRALAEGFTIHVDTREKYAFRFARREVAIEQGALVAGDYGVRDGDRWLAVVERKSLEDLIGSLANGTLAFQLAAMAELPLAAVVVEGR